MGGSMKDVSLFRGRVYAAVARIPRGKVASYGLVAMLAGRPGAARAVGAAMREVPEALQGRLPCHRVLRADGALAPKRIFGGRQRGMLEREGVAFGGNGKVVMKRCEWEGGAIRRGRGGRGG